MANIPTIRIGAWMPKNNDADRGPRCIDADYRPPFASEVLVKQQNKLIVVFLGLTLVISSWAASKKDGETFLEELAAQSGLVKTKKKNIDLLFKRPDATLSKYDRLQIMPISVHFDKNFDPGGNSQLYRMNPPDREKIKAGIAELFAEVFKEELAKGGYKVVDESGADVLEVHAAIANLYIVAPDVSMQTAGRVRTYTADAGSMTLVMELRDSVSGASLAHIYDGRAATSSTWNWTTSVSNIADARQIISIWATELRKAFDASRTPD